MDYSYSGARWVQMYLKEKYGKENVAQIGTKGTLAARAVLRKVGKTLAIDSNVVDAFAKKIPKIPDITLAEAFEMEKDIKGYANMYPEFWKTALALEGHLASFGTHAGGIVIAPVPIHKVAPIRTDDDGLETTMYDMGWIEKFLVKFDVLKVETLDLIKSTMEMAGLWGKMDVEDIPMNDPYVFEKVYNAGQLEGVFQCESSLFKKIIKDLKPTNFDDINVIVALGRPGPLDLIPDYVERKWGRQEVTYPFDSLKPVLEETYGVWVKIRPL